MNHHPRCGSDHHKHQDHTNRRRTSRRNIVSSLYELATYMVDQKRVLFVTGAGLSVDSGIRPFRVHSSDEASTTSTTSRYRPKTIIPSSQPSVLPQPPINNATPNTETITKTKMTNGGDENHDDHHHLTKEDDIPVASHELRRQLRSSSTCRSSNHNDHDDKKKKINNQARQQQQQQDPKKKMTTTKGTVAATKNGNNNNKATKTTTMTATNRNKTTNTTTTGHSSSSSSSTSAGKASAGPSSSPPPTMTTTTLGQPSRYHDHVLQAGLWNEVIWNTATRECFRKDPLTWYNAFWIPYFCMTSHQPNIGHVALDTLLSLHPTSCHQITQNIDGLQQQSSSSSSQPQQLIEVHGRCGLFKCCPSLEQEQEWIQYEEQHSDDDDHSSGDNDNDNDDNNNNGKGNSNHHDDTNNNHRHPPRPHKKRLVRLGHRKMTNYWKQLYNDTNVDHDDNDDNNVMTKNHHKKRNNNNKKKKNHHQNKPCPYQYLLSLTPEQIQFPIRHPQQQQQQQQQQQHSHPSTTSTPTTTTTSDLTTTTTPAAAALPFPIVTSSSSSSSSSSLASSPMDDGDDKKNPLSSSLPSLRRVTRSSSSSSCRRDHDDDTNIKNKKNTTTIPTGADTKTSTTTTTTTNGDRNKTTTTEVLPTTTTMMTAATTTTTKLKEVPKCPHCGNDVMPQALLFDEGYHSHTYYQYDLCEEWISSADIMVFIGTSFAVRITQICLQHARNYHIPVYNFNLAHDTLESTIWLNVTNIVGPVSITLPQLLAAVYDLQSQKQQQILPNAVVPSLSPSQPDHVSHHVPQQQQAIVLPSSTRSSSPKRDHVPTNVKDDDHGVVPPVPHDDIITEEGECHQVNDDNEKNRQGDTMKVPTPDEDRTTIRNSNVDNQQTKEKKMPSEPDELSLPDDDDNNKDKHDATTVVDNDEADDDDDSEVLDPNTILYQQYARSVLEKLLQQKNIITTNDNNDDKMDASLDKTISSSKQDNMTKPDSMIDDNKQRNGSVGEPPRPEPLHDMETKQQQVTTNSNNDEERHQNHSMMAKLALDRFSHRDEEKPNKPMNHDTKKTMKKKKLGGDDQAVLDDSIQPNQKRQCHETSLDRSGRRQHNSPKVNVTTMNDMDRNKDSSYHPVIHQSQKQNQQQQLLQQLQHLSQISLLQRLQQEEDEQREMIRRRQEQQQQEDEQREMMRRLQEQLQQQQQENEQREMIRMLQEQQQQQQREQQLIQLLQQAKQEEEQRRRQEQQQQREQQLIQLLQQAKQEEEQREKMIRRRQEQLQQQQQQQREEQLIQLLQQEKQRQEAFHLCNQQLLQQQQQEQEKQQLLSLLAKQQQQQNLSIFGHYLESSNHTSMNPSTIISMLAAPHPAVDPLQAFRPPHSLSSIPDLNDTVSNSSLQNSMLSMLLRK